MERADAPSHRSRGAKALGGPRVVVTGLGMVTPFASDREASWQAIRSGKRATRHVELRYPLADREAAAAGAAEFRAGRFQCLGAPAMLPESFDGGFITEEPTLRIARAAAKDAWAQAWRDGQPSSLDRHRTGCVIGTSKGGLASAAAFLAGQFADDADGALRFTQFLPNAVAAAVAMELGLLGPTLCPVAACATGLVSLQRGVGLIREGTCDVVVAGSADASLVPAVAASFQRLGVLARSEDPAAACRPYDRNRSGFVIGEGAGILVLERLDHAEARGAPILAEWLADGLLSDAAGVTHLDPEARGLQRLIGDLLSRGETPKEAIDYVNLHGTGTRENDVCETRGLRRAFGPIAGQLRCSSLKGAMGHLLGAAGSVEMVCTVLAMRDGIVPPTANLRSPDPECDLDYTPVEPRKAAVRTALKLSLGFGGHLAAALVRAYPARRDF